MTLEITYETLPSRFLDPDGSSFYITAKSVSTSANLHTFLKKALALFLDSAIMNLLLQTNVHDKCTRYYGNDENKTFSVPMTVVSQRAGGRCKPVGASGGPLSEPSAMSRQGKPFTAVRVARLFMLCNAGGNAGVYSRPLLIRRTRVFYFPTCCNQLSHY